ncbi:hypothetical protein [Sphingomonas carotinifaciens]|uniref:hypothetical protein n=1 Tax=Sphingomonas carotinifaciens TaxID=1166323 RepID=UPI001237645D|nr:hypothetical protein [Sphingomonas carotinifaciens]
MTYFALFALLITACEKSEPVRQPFPVKNIGTFKVIDPKIAVNMMIGKIVKVFPNIQFTLNKDGTYDRYVDIVYGSNKYTVNGKTICFKSNNTICYFYVISEDGIYEIPSVPGWQYASKIEIR